MRKEDADFVTVGVQLKVKVVPTYSRPQISDTKRNGQNRYINNGDLLTVKKKERSGSGYRFYFKEFLSHNQYLTLSQVELSTAGSTVENIHKSMKVIQQQIERLYEKQSVLKQKISYVEETGTKRIDPVAFKAWLMVKQLEDMDKSTTKEKTDMMTKILKMDS